MFQFEVKEVSIKMTTYRDLGTHRNMCDTNYNSTWSISHIPTGTVIWSDLESKALAEKLMKLVYKYTDIDWSMKDVTGFHITYAKAVSFARLNFYHWDEGK